MGAVALLGSAAVAGGGTTYALSTFMPQTRPESAVAANATATTAEAARGGTASTASSTRPTPEPTLGPVETGPRWAYDGPTGPDHWGELDSASSVCGQGGSQSPLDLTASLRVAALAGLPFAYGPTRLRVSNTGRTFQVNVDKGSSLSFDGKRYDLQEFHFHTPSEHTLDGRTYPLEIQFAHLATDKSMLAVALLVTEGAPNSSLMKISDKLPRARGEFDTTQTIDLKDLLPRNVDEYLTYAGSLTTPPCTENVRWVVLQHTIEMSKAQIAAFRSVFAMNARPTQPLGARTVLAS